jgi:hypothetical protein
MDSIKIDSGVKRILVNDDPTRVIQFNPTDITFAERFYNLIGEFERKQNEYQKRAEEIEKQTEVDANGVPQNIGARITLLREVCEYVRGKIDHLFGEGSSEAAFGDVLSLEMFTQFFDGITPFVQSARNNKLAQYNKKLSGRVMK